MTHSLINAHLRFNVRPAGSNWDCFSRAVESLGFSNLRLGIGYHTKKSKYWALDNWHPNQIKQDHGLQSPHGPLDQITIHTLPDTNRLSYKLHFALPQEHPLLLWKLEIDNQGNQAVFIDRLELLNAGFINITKPNTPSTLRLAVRQELERGSARIYLGQPATKPKNLSKIDLAFFSNGWQSWSITRLYEPYDKYVQSRLGFLRKTVAQNAHIHSGREGLIPSDMFGILGNRTTRTAILTGFLSQKQHFGCVETYLYPEKLAMRLYADGDCARLDPGMSLETDWGCMYFFHLDEPDPLKPYLDAVTRQHGLTEDHFLTGKVSPSGWCSWYQFSKEDFTGEVSSQDIRENVHAAASLHPHLPLELIQIDDGFEAQIGDWLSFKHSFPEGVAPLAREIKQAGLTPGLWLAPFIVHPRSNLSKNHPEWLLRNRINHPVNAGFLWNSITTALDMTHPGSNEYVRDVIGTACHRWGFPYLKLDFLYAAALAGRFHDPTKSRAQVLRLGLEAIRESAGPQTILLGCGCPLGPAVGLVDNMRVSADTARSWYPRFLGQEKILKSESSLPSAKNALHNTLTRAALHGRWWINDPDCLLLRPGTRLTLDEIQSIATVIALSGGPLLVSDHLPDLPADRIQIARVLLPLIAKRPFILDWFDSPTPSRVQVDLEGPCGKWHLLALFNWADHAQDLGLKLNEFYLDPQKEYLAREFWTAQNIHLVNGRFNFPNVPAHAVRLIAIRSIYPHHPQYIGSNLHISQGLEVTTWQASPNELKIGLERPGAVSGEIALSLPASPREVTINNQRTSIIPTKQNIYNLPVEFNQKAIIQVYW